MHAIDEWLALLAFLSQNDMLVCLGGLSSTLLLMPVGFRSHSLQIRQSHFPNMATALPLPAGLEAI